MLQVNSHRFIENLTPLCAVALAATASCRIAADLKVFLQSYILGEIYFLATTHSINPPIRNSAQDLHHDDLTFSMAFHLSYPALRDGPALSDFRGIRQSYSMIKPMGNSIDELLYYDAQISFLVTGTDETHWTAYCIIDTYLGSDQGANAFFLNQKDGPSGGAQPESQPCWNPRGYFLLVLSQRIKQTTREWRNIISTLMDRLDAYVCITT
jgi:hypothetical protein